MNNINNTELEVDLADLNQNPSPKLSATEVLLNGHAQTAISTAFRNFSIDDPLNRAIIQTIKDKIAKDVEFVPGTESDLHDFMDVQEAQDKFTEVLAEAIGELLDDPNNRKVNAAYQEYIETVANIIDDQIIYSKEDNIDRRDQFAPAEVKDQEPVPA